MSLIAGKHFLANVLCFTYEYSLTKGYIFFYLQFYKFPNTF